MVTLGTDGLICNAKYNLKLYEKVCSDLNFI